MPQRTCAQCNKEFLVPSPKEWIYRKMVYEQVKKGKIVFFCSRGCERAYSEEHMMPRSYIRRVDI